VLALATAVIQLGDGRACILQQSRVIGRVAPGLCDDSNAVARPDLLFIEIDQEVEGGGIDVALLGQDRFQRDNSEWS
jgi:hypothetical protein